MTRLFRVLSLAIPLWVSLGALSCGETARDSAEGASAYAPEASAPPPSAAPGSAPQSTSRPTPSPRPRIVFLGDSLTAGFGLAAEEAFPAVLQRRVDADRLGFTVVNAGVSGDTSAGGLSRLGLALEGDVRVLVVALGGNDALRGLPVDALERNLSAIIERAQARAIRVLLAGMEAPPNFGQTYVVSFRKVYSDLARKYRVALLPFLLQNVAGVESLNQRDGIHPTAEGARKVADNVWAVLRPMLKG
jgi:acyl-CoA thioesterase-1